MSPTVPLPVDAADLRRAGRSPELPFVLPLADGSRLVVHQLLRALPGKRLVGRGEWQGRAVLAKLFLDASSARRCAAEAAGIERLLQAGLPTPECVFVGALPGGGHVLMTAYLAGARTLAESWAAGTDSTLALLGPAFRLLGSLHAQGIVQEDMHLGNFLLAEDRLWMIDGDGVRAAGASETGRRNCLADNLALLLAQLPPDCDARHAELLDAYRSGRGRLPANEADLERRVDLLRERRLADFLRKSLRECSLFQVSRTPTRFVALRREAASVHTGLTGLLDDPDRAIGQGVLLKDGRTSTVARVQLPTGPVVVKRYNLKNAWHALGRFWRPSRAWHSWRSGHRLAFLGIATPEPLALIEERLGPFRRRAFLVTGHCPGNALDSLLDPQVPPPPELAGALRDLFRALARFRITHGDLKATNLLCHDGRIFLVDLDAMVRHRSPTAYHRAWAKDRARFVRNWPEGSPLRDWLAQNLPPADEAPA